MEKCAAGAIFLAILGVQMLILQWKKRAAGAKIFAVLGAQMLVLQWKNAPQARKFCDFWVPKICDFRETRKPPPLLRARFSTRGGGFSGLDRTDGLGWFWVVSGWFHDPKGQYFLRIWIPVYVRRDRRRL